jgi:transcriptional regulator
MHTYPDYIAPSGRAIAQFVHDNPFAVMASSTPAAPLATHTPVVFPPGVEPGDSLVGKRLWGHIGRANDHWQLFAENPYALFVFSTSHAYVSPSAYQFTPAVPTLDYAAVHLTGRVTVLEEARDSLAVVEQTVYQLEGRRSEQWDPTDSEHVFKQILSGVVSFTIDVETESAMFKLSQDMPKDVHERVRRDLVEGDHYHPDVADLMGDIGVTEKPEEGQ